MNLLIAEADPFVAGLLARYGEECGLACGRVQTGEELLALAWQTRPDILVADPELPGAVRGWQALQALQARWAAEGLTVITCSWRPEPEVRRRLDRVAAHLQKPDLFYPDFVAALALAAAPAASPSFKPDSSSVSELLMQTAQYPATGWNIELASKPDFNMAMQRIYAWYEQQVIDRPPVRFSRHNAEYEQADSIWKPAWQGLRDKWFDVEYQLDRFLLQVEGPGGARKHYHGETFPIFWPNLGPSVFSAFYGCPLEFEDVTSWAIPILEDYGQPLALDRQNAYFRKLEEMTCAALEICAGRFLVGYSDLHPGLDWLAGLRGTQRLLYDMVDTPDAPLPLLARVTDDFLAVYDHFDALLKAKGQPSVTWMAIPSFGKMHIPSCDFASMISPRQFRTYALPALQAEVQHMTHNIFHVDGKGVARHLDAILDLPNVQAIQWVQGVGEDAPIMQWVPLIKRVQAAGKSAVVDLTPAELDDFIEAVRPEGIFITTASEDEAHEQAILKRIARW